MLFNSYEFIFLFLPVVVAVYALLRSHAAGSWSIGWLVLASLFYYAWWMPAFLALLLGSLAVNAWLGTILCSGRLTRGQSRALLTTGIAFNLGLLAYFKYTGFFLQNLNAAFSFGIPVPHIILPIGISFITFQKIAFLVDAHRGLVRNFSLANFALFVTFFPQLIAGPIVHHGEVMPQFARPPAAQDFGSNLAIGLSIFCVGLFKKVVVADSCAIYADAGYGALQAGRALDALSAWITVTAFSFQLYYDFSGYSDMAVGLARLFGIRLPVNFHSPYKATGIIDFWRRWHITLSRFLRDYLYIPLGGNRAGELRRNVNVAIVMLLGGLWHGASWTFVVWGAIHGAMILVNQAWQRLALARHAAFAGARLRALSIAITFVAVTLAWIPFRAENLAQARAMLSALAPEPYWAVRSLLQFVKAQLAAIRHLDYGYLPRELWPAELPANFLARYPLAGATLIVVAVATFWLPNTQQLFARFEPVLGIESARLPHPWSLARLDWRVAAVLSAVLVASVLQLSRVSPFLYYQF